MKRVNSCRGMLGHVACFLVVMAVAMLSSPVQGRLGLLHTYHLRVYGNIIARSVKHPAKASVAYQELSLGAENHAKAVIVISKLLRDFSTLPTVRARNVTAGGVTVPALYFDAGRVLLPVLQRGSAKVYVYSFGSAAAMQKFLKKDPAALTGAGDYSGRHYPFYLDFWDRHCQGSWYHLLNSPGYRGALTSDNDCFHFMQRYGMCVNTAPPYMPIRVRADRYNIGYLFNRWMDVSNWLLNTCPQAVSRGDPDMTWQYWGYGDVPVAKSPLQILQTVEMVHFYSQFAHDDHLVSFTDPYGEISTRDPDLLGLTNRGHYSRLDFIHYLRDYRHLTLRELGRRWYGQPNRFHHWKDVRFPRQRDFYGWKTGRSQELAGTWRTINGSCAVGEKLGYYKSGLQDANWLAFRHPGTQYLAGGVVTARRPGGGWVRFAFRPQAQFLGTHASVYLTICPFSDAPWKNPDVVYLNGHKLGAISFGSGLEWSQFSVGKLLHGGRNVLAAYTPTGNVDGPVFLTTEKAPALTFPMTNAHLNARLYDLRNWDEHCVVDANVRILQYLRYVLPNQPIKIMVLADDVSTPELKKYGVYGHFTGEGAFFHEHYKRLGYLYGVPASAETSQSCGSLHELKKVFFIATYEGLNAFDYFYDLRDILIHPKRQAWYRKHLPYFQLMGRFDLQKPQIAILTSQRVDRFFVGVSGASSYYDNDPGRGDIQQAHYGYVECDEQAIDHGLVNGYKVILDDNACLLRKQDVQGLERYVRQGGTVVLNQRTGRGTYLKSYSWPIDALTGCAATVRPQTGTVRFVQHPAILASYAGETFKNDGRAINWQKYNYFGDCIALKPQVKGIDVVARYQDGAPAIVVRKLGKGRVVVLGSALYRQSRDAMHGFWVGSPAQAAFYQALFSSLGVAPLIYSANPHLWAERFIANSGSTEMLILGNEGRKKAISGARATWNLGFAARRIFDPVTGKTIPASFHGTSVTLSNLNLKPFQMRYFAAELTNRSAVWCVRHWLFRQSQLWHAVPAGKALPKLGIVPPTLTLLGQYQVKQLNSQATAEAALAVDYKTNSTWQRMFPADWLSAGLRTGPNLWGVYRKHFVISKAWLTGVRGVQALWDPNPLGGVPDEIELNGHMVIKNDQRVADWRQVLLALHPGRNLFTFICRGRDGDGDGGFVNSFGLGRIPAGRMMDISKDWTIYRTETDKYQSSLPLRANIIMIRKSVMIPATDRGDSVWVQVASADGNFHAIVNTNGRERYTTNTSGKAPHPALVNITPDVHFGRANDLVVGGLNTDSQTPSPMALTYVRLYFVPPHASPAGPSASR